MIRRCCLMLQAMLLTVPAAVGAQGRGGPVPPAIRLTPIDRQVVRDQDVMTWAEDYKPIPGVDWTDPRHRPSGRTIRFAMILADFADQPFVMTLPKHSDRFGNPQIDPVPRERIAQFYADFWNKPRAINYGHTVHEYWMELSHGRIGVEFTPFGPYRMPGSYTARNNAMLDSIWRTQAGVNIREGLIS